MDFQKLLENKPLLYAIIGGAIGLVLLIGILGAVLNKGGSKSDGMKTVSSQPIQTDVDLLTTDNLGKALEIQALLAKKGIAVSRKVDGTKSVLYLRKGDCTTGLKKCTTEQRDLAVIAIVESGLFDENVGLEVFDKGDFTSTKEDKKIRLTRAVNGELSRLIRKISNVDTASVFISIPEQSMFSSMQKAITATVQISTKDGERLDQNKVKAITNLLLGSVSGLSGENISITDTNGNVYHSIMNASDEMIARLEENDRYMQKKVATQLDSLVGKGNYVATVSTFVRQAPVEKYTIEYNPDKRAEVSQQSFREGLGDQATDASTGTGAVSVYLPNGLNTANSNSSSSQNRNYSRTATETQYGVSKTQINEYIAPGVVEEISIAVTLDRNALPTNVTLTELKELIAKAANPKVSADDVSIAFKDSTEPNLIDDKLSNLPNAEDTGNPWWLTIALSGAGVLLALIIISSKIKSSAQINKEELEMIRQQTAQQNMQLDNINQQTAQLASRQSELAQGLLEQQNRVVSIPQQDTQSLVNALNTISNELANGEEDSSDKIKSWIEEN